MGMLAGELPFENSESRGDEHDAEHDGVLSVLDAEARRVAQDHKRLLALVDEGVREVEQEKENAMQSPKEADPTPLHRWSKICNEYISERSFPTSSQSDRRTGSGEREGASMKRSFQSSTTDCSAAGHHAPRSICRLEHEAAKHTTWAPRPSPAGGQIQAAAHQTARSVDCKWATSDNLSVAVAAARPAPDMRNNREFLVRMAELIERFDARRSAVMGQLDDELQCQFSGRSCPPNYTLSALSV